ncbi:hypothetical protein GGG87_06870 [Streptococcus sp. zg-86]|uniref:NAD/NADP octopine/nopaline dehydrogenase n=1 Tax=Streptococcus zhangguiae TaxID=2664091 RepID=A0A6I4RH95_9STRE|nr:MULTISPECIES: NAD/NADP octopine/nopaline dehydrogenase family protein [unclassified Streptococcus]MTB64713.1 hypothetical protein [Streptococcus sp. zg-86]MTB91539.1 hypothetical protein [Streptococcus sp. zg-36]MWV56784.1 hypothetical protein [Streptococcus sp. zg-70]QTH48515.1 NAD/NADP octopine/nopaline dehydrogenase family protein [Streptococcus sp. zg-86]
MKIGIIGSGNLGTAIAADLGRKHEVKLYSSHPENFTDKLIYIDDTTKATYTGYVHLVSSSYELVVSDIEMLFICLPTFLIKDTITGIIPFLDNSVKIGFVPGAGGIEYLTKELIDRNFTIFGFERVPYVARIEEYGKSVSASKKNNYRIATIPNGEAVELASCIANLFNTPCQPMKQFMAMTLTPTLHTSRLFDLYQDYKAGEELAENPYFYGEWRDSASTICFELDRELHTIARELQKNGIMTDELIPYSVHYESESPFALTQKLQSIKSLSTIKGPLVQKENGKYIVDLASRYFIESYPYRLAIVKGLAELLKIQVPKTDEVLSWYSQLEEKEYYLGGSFVGKDISECNIPQNSGIITLKDLIKLYQI